MSEVLATKYNIVKHKRCSNDNGKVLRSEDPLFKSSVAAGYNPTLRHRIILRVRSPFNSVSEGNVEKKTKNRKGRLYQIYLVLTTCNLHYTDDPVVAAVSFSTRIEIAQTSVNLSFSRPSDFFGAPKSPPSPPNYELRRVS